MEIPEEPNRTGQKQKQELDKGCHWVHDKNILNRVMATTGLVNIKHNEIVFILSQINNETRTFSRPKPLRDFSVEKNLPQQMIGSSWNRTADL